MRELTKNLRRTIALLAVATVSIALGQRAVAQDQQEQDDPPSRVARIGYIQGSVSFQPGGQSEWVEAVPNRPMTTGDQIWVDRDSRAELSLGSAVIDLNSNTGASFLNLDDRTVQVQLSSGSVSIRVRHLDRDDVFEIDTPNQAFSIFQPGRYRVEASEDGKYTVVSIREGEGESTGNGQTYTLHHAQRWTFEGSDRLNAQVDELGDPDDFDNWSYNRDRRHEDSPSARYVSHDVVGYEDLDDNGDWHPDAGYGNVWYPHVSPGWAPYREGHWAWIDPWGWTWVDDESWGYAPFHYGRWLSIRGRWGWVPGPPEVRPVYAPALVVFVGGGGGGFGGNVGWFPLGPREVYVPSYPVSRGYVNRVNVSNTTVNVTTVTNVYNTTIINKTTNITNVTYANRSVSGAVTAVPQHSFASAQPVSRSAVQVNAQDIASAPVNSRASFAPTSVSVLGAHANTANRVAAPPAAVASRAVVAKAPAPPPPVPFAARQQALAAHPGQPIARQEMQRMQPANNAATAARPQVKQAPPAVAATPTVGRPGNQPGNVNANRPGNAPINQPTTQPVNQPTMNQPTTQPANRPGNPPAANEHPVVSPVQPNRPAPYNQPATNNRPVEPPVRNDHAPVALPNNRPEPIQPPPNNNRPEPIRPQHSQPVPNNRPVEPPVRNDRPPVAQPNNRPVPNQPPPNQPPPNTNRPEPYRPPQPNPPAPNNRTVEPPHNTPPPAQARPAQPPPRQLTPEEKKKQDEQQKKDEKPHS
jgi:FecR protein